MLETQEELDIMAIETEPTEPDIDETETADDTDYLGSATYCPEDDKLRFTADARLSKEDYTKIVKTYGFTWAPKQEIFVAVWTPSREDLLLKWCGSIDDEDYSPEERAADRAERFNGYLGKRLGEATGAADTFASGPNAFGHQSQARAERQARRHDRHRSYAVNQWSKAEYWQTRTAGVISNALHRSSAAVRRSRLLKLEAEERKLNKSQQEHATKWGLWEKVLTLDGGDLPVIAHEDNRFIGISPETSPAGKLAYALANSGGGDYDFQHPRNPERKASLYSLLTGIDPITPAEAARMWLKRYRRPDDQNGHSYRWSQHLALRIEYEKAMLANEGGIAGEAEIVPGGWIKPSRRDVQFGRAHVNAEGYSRILKVFKSNATGRVTSVQVMGDDRYLNDTTVKPRTINIERLGEDCYRAPTPEELEAFKDSTKERKVKEKASKPKAPPLINPTEADALRLQAIFNARGQAKHAKAKAEHRTYSDFEPLEVQRMTQEEYSQATKSSYTHLETATIHNGGGIVARQYSNMWTEGGQKYDQELGPAVCKIRIYRKYDFVACRVVFITDKPAKPLPVDWVKLCEPTKPKQ